VNAKTGADLKRLRTREGDKMSKVAIAVFSILVMAGNIRAQHGSPAATQQQIREAQQLANLKRVFAQLQAATARGQYIAPGVRREIPVPGLLRVQPNGRPGFNVLSRQERDYVRAACERARAASAYAQSMRC
jgi:hypothetical protein